MLRRNACNAVGWGVFFILLLTYWLTVAPTVSYWDCPEYVAAAWRLEVGHPPGNPVWMLVERVITLLVPSGKYAALAINLSSGLFTAFSGFFLYRSLYMVLGWIFANREAAYPELIKTAAAATGALAFGWCDSAWYSAVEAEVYAMSIFMTSLCIWLMLKWVECNDSSRSTRYLILISYLFGLSVGIHQLNLLCIPAIVLIWGFKRGKGKWWKVLLLFLFSLFAVGVVLLVIMPGMIWLASVIELFAVNSCRLPFLSGVVLFIALMGIVLLAALYLTHRFNARRLHTLTWMVSLLLTGYSSYALIPIRGDVPSPANSVRPGDPFSFASYLSREQYGNSPLLYGRTPLSKPVLREEWTAKGKPVYKRYLLKRTHPVWVRKQTGMTIGDKYHLLTHEDSVSNCELLKRRGDAYLKQGYLPKPVYTPELDMWFPRITSSDPVDFPLFDDWAGMTRDNMKRVAVSQAVDTCGNFVSKFGTDGKRVVEFSYRPTYWQSLRMFAAYQAGYMYLRYLMWNFSGRQNDYHSTGEVEHGNFITGFMPLDNAMLGAENALPDHLGKDNPGRNRYYMLPFLLGLFGLIWLLAQGKLGVKTDIVVFTVFMMTGLAITVYLNQSLGEPRERDYSFLGSFWAFALWIGFGAAGLMKACRQYAPIAMAIPIFCVVWMFKENLDDHNRSHRYAASAIASNILNSLPQDAILFVNGDNATFPLWYAQEVENVRTDVRVVNLAYLGTEAYTDALLRDWRDSKRLHCTLSRSAINSGTLHFTKFDNASTEAPLDALDVLRMLDSTRNPEIACKSVYIRGIGMDTIPFPLVNLSKGSNSSIDFRRLVIMDIIATNASDPTPRPVHWLRTLPENAYAGFKPFTSPSLFSQGLGNTSPEEREGEYLAVLKKLQAPNSLENEPYMDPLPAGQVSIHRASLLIAAKDMLRQGFTETACKLALASDSLIGRNCETYKAVHDGDSTFATSHEAARLFADIADSIRMKPVVNVTRGNLARLDSISRELNGEVEKRKKQWEIYKRTLPPRLRFKTSK